MKSVDESTRAEINKLSSAVLRDAGIVAPPVPVEAIVDHLNMFRDFYDLEDPSFLDKAKHKIRLHRKRLVQVVRKIKLVAVLLYDQDKILIDESLPHIKHDWSTCHEIGHRILPWHKTYFRGDTTETLHPDWHEQLESEANMAASNFMFGGPIFTEEARETSPCWTTVKQLTSRYGKSMTATLRRYVEYGPDIPMAMLVSLPSWTSASAQDGNERCSHCVGSQPFNEFFSWVEPSHLLDLVDINAQEKRGGPVADFTFPLCDDRGEAWEFRAESFFNSHYILTIFVAFRDSASISLVVPVDSGT